MNLTFEVTKKDGVITTKIKLGEEYLLLSHVNSRKLTGTTGEEHCGVFSQGDIRFWFGQESRVFKLPQNPFSFVPEEERANSFIAWVNAVQYIRDWVAQEKTKDSVNNYLFTLV